jgi:small subunit ribosomal protein S5
MSAKARHTDRLLSRKRYLYSCVILVGLYHPGVCVLRRRRLPPSVMPGRLAHRLISIGSNVLRRNVVLRAMSSSPPSWTEEESAGRDLAKLALISKTTRDAIAAAGARGDFSPELLVDLEIIVSQAQSLITAALDKAGRPCTPDQLAERVSTNVVPIPTAALEFRQLLLAGDLRDTMESCLVQMNVQPPADAMIDGSGKPFCRLERKAARRREFEGATDGDHAFDENEDPNARNRRRRNATSNIPPVSESEIARRKAALESAAKIDNVLRGFDTALLEVSRVNKVTRGGTTMNMRALVAIGNRAGTAGYGEGKSDTVAHAIERACRDARRNLLYVERYNGRTIFHDSVGNYVKSSVVLWPAPPGRGISANNNFSAIFQLFGINDVGAKLHGPRSMANSVKALFNGLSKIQTAEQIGSSRGLRLASPVKANRVRQRGVASLIHRRHSS